MVKNVLQPLPVGTSNFVALRDAGQIYVDKTQQIYQLASVRQKFFLTRPRRFGGIRDFWLMGYSGEKITLREIWLIKYPSRQLNACERLAPALFYSHDKGGG